MKDLYNNEITLRNQRIFHATISLEISPCLRASVVHKIKKVPISRMKQGLLQGSKQKD